MSSTPNDTYWITNTISVNRYFEKTLACLHFNLADPRADCSGKLMVAPLSANTTGAREVLYATTNGEPILVGINWGGEWEWEPSGMEQIICDAYWLLHDEVTEAVYKWAKRIC